MTVGTAQAQAVPFRQATIERTSQILSDTLTQGTNSTRIEHDIEGSGFIYGIVLDTSASTAANAASVGLTEDAPWSIYDTVVYRDVNGELLNLSGYNLYLSNLAMKQYSVGSIDGGNGAFPVDSSVYSAPTSGTGATAGSYHFMLDVPIGLNRRDLTGILGNQDRAQKYYLRDDVASLGAVYTTNPTTAPTIQINRYYENYAVPLQVGPSGQPQQVVPDSFGVLHYITATSSASQPQGGSTINHYLQRIENTVRSIILVFRSNGSRATAQANAPSRIQMKLGEDTIFDEPYAYRRYLMYKRWGFSWPNGVLIYDAMHDFLNGAGDELGDDYYHTQALVNAQFIISYPSGFGSANNSLYVVTDDLQDTTGASASGANG